MSDVLAIILISFAVTYTGLCGIYGAEPGAPLWLSWPMPIWNWIAHDWRRPRARPDYAKIDRLERELGIVESPSRKLSSFEQEVRDSMERP